MKRRILKILLVEDERDVCRSIESYLGRRGFQISKTSSGKEALSLIKIFKPDMVLLDFTLYDMNGKDMLKKLRQYDKQTKVIVITGEMLSRQQVKKIYSLGICEYLNKPISLEQLENVINTALGRKSKPVKQNSISRKGNDDKGSTGHCLYNLLGIIRSKCENFILDMEDGIYEGKQDKELVKIALKRMSDVIKTVDRAVNAIQDGAKREKGGNA